MARYLASGRSPILRGKLATSALGWGACVGLLAAMAPQAHAQEALPTGGAVTSGAATITTAPGAVTVDQSSTRAIVNWSSFDVGAGKAVVFRQPDAGSATLNRVTGSTSSTIAGQIVSNGAVYLVNPNGIAITASGNVQTGGGFVASTLDIADADFNAGKLAFAGTGASARVSNTGAITAGAGGYVALLGGSVSNAGTITVPLGRVGLGSGEQIALDLNGDGFLRVAVPTTAITGGDGALVELAGSIAASGGRVELRAATARDAVRNVVNMSGSIVADSATGSGGSIVLLGGDGGTVKATGTLSARATGAHGDGGFIETSGAQVDFTGLSVDASAANGRFGTWLVDPYNVTISTAADARQTGFTATGNNSVVNSTTLLNALRTANVTVQTGSSGTQAGNITLATGTPLTWTSGSTLTLQAAGNIALNSAITALAGGLTLTPGGGAGNTGSATATAAIDIGTFTLTNGSWVQNTASLPGFRATDFRFTVGNASFLRAAGGAGTSASPYLLSDVYGLQGMASTTLLGSSFTLANDIDASGTANWNGGAGFVTIGAYIAPGTYAYDSFTGTFDGANHVIAALTIARPGTEFLGLFGSLTGTIAYVGLTEVSIQGSRFTAGLAAQQTDGIIRNVYVTGAVSGTNVVALLVGQQNGGTINNAWVAGSASGGNPVGGLVAEQNGGSISNVYSTAAVSGTGYVGGLVGNQNSPGTISNAYASGPVSGSASSINGLVGIQNGGISNAYWDTYSTGRSAAFSSTSPVYRSVSNVSSVTSDPNQSGAANYAYKASAYINLAAASGIGTANVTGFAFLPGNSTRPFLAFEVPTTTSTPSRSGVSVIETSHQLQLVGYDATRLAASYLLGRDIDLAETSRVTVGTPASYGGMWAGTGFSPIGQSPSFTGTFDGGNHVLSGLTINSQATYYAGLFSDNDGTIRNVGLLGGRVTGQNVTGALAGSSSGTIDRVYATVTVAGGDSVGGLVGYQYSGGISNVYAAGAASGGTYVGGLVGYQRSGTIGNAYATGAVAGTENIGGLVGLNLGTINSVYASGRVRGTTYVGGVVGQQYAAVSNAYWDSYSTGQSVGIGGSLATITNLNAVSSNPNESDTASYAYKAGAYANLAAASGIGTANVAGFAFLPGNSTRPFLAFEVPTAASTPALNGVPVIETSHQLQLIGYDATRLAGSYLLGRDIDLAETGRNEATTANAASSISAASASGMWTNAGFVALGTNGGGLTWDGTTFRSVGTITSGIYGFSGAFDGGGSALSNLTIRRAGVGNTGLFGTVSGTIRNVSVGGTVSGGNGTGGLVGMLIGGPTTSTTGLSPIVAGVTSTVDVTGLQVVGGLVGSATQRSSVLNSTASGTVSGTNTVGGLIGSANRATVTGSATGAVNGQAYVGGLIGQQFAGTTTGFATGAVTGTLAVGGLIGVVDGTATERGTATATRSAQSGVTGPSSADRNFGRVTANATATTVP